MTFSCGIFRDLMELLYILQTWFQGLLSLKKAWLHTWKEILYIPPQRLHSLYGILWTEGDLCITSSPGRSFQMRVQPEHRLRVTVLIALHRLHFRDGALRIKTRPFASRQPCQLQGHGGHATLISEGAEGLGGWLGVPLPWHCWSQAYDTRMCGLQRQ